MLAAVIMAVALTSVLAVTSHASRYVSDFRKAARASQILQQRMEDIRLLSWSQLEAYPAVFVDSTIGIYTGRVTQTTVDSFDGLPTLKVVSLTLTWHSQTGRHVTNSLTTLVSNGGLNTYIF
jgi:Tfp pilus assembly protein PilV